MDALVMCGGAGTRLDADVEKPLLPVAGRPMVDRVVDALSASRVDAIHAAVSPNAPETRAHLRERAVETIETPGEGYVADLDRALDRVDAPVLTVAADLPLLDADPVDGVLDAHGSGSLAVCVPAALKRLLGVSVDATMDPSAGDGEEAELAPTGLNVVGDDARDGTDPTGDVYLTYDARLAVNVNRPADAEIAEELA